MADKCHAEGPASYNGGNGPGKAVELPTKHYPQYDKLAKSPKVNIDSPANKK